LSVVSRWKKLFTASFRYLISLMLLGKCVSFSCVSLNFGRPTELVNGAALSLYSFREHQYEVLEHCPRMHVHAEPITVEDAARLLNRASVTSCRNLFYLVLMEKQVEFVLAAESVWVSC